MAGPGNDVIYEAVVSTQSPQGDLHLAPMGVRYPGEGGVLLMPFRPSRTLDNLLATGQAVVNLVLDTRVFAGCVTGRRDWPHVPTRVLQGQRLAAAARHLELRLAAVTDDPTRPLLHTRIVHDETHLPFPGFNRAQAAVVEAAVLVSRLGRLPPEKVDQEMAYLQIAIDKTASPAEHEAWGWLRDAVARHRHAASPPPATGASAATPEATR